MSVRGCNSSMLFSASGYSNTMPTACPSSPLAILSNTEIASANWKRWVMSRGTVDPALRDQVEKRLMFRFAVQRT